MKPRSFELAAAALLFAAAAGCNANTDTGPAGSDCSPDDTVVCTGNSVGYTCTGSETPEEAIPTLACSDPAPEGGAQAYCCVETSTASTCMSDEMVTGCAEGSIGFSCTGTDTPDQDDASLMCGMGADAGNGVTDYCCSN
jgi:hypothetical protein